MDVKNREFGEEEKNSWYKPTSAFWPIQLVFWVVCRESIQLRVSRGKGTILYSVIFFMAVRN